MHLPTLRSLLAATAYPLLALMAATAYPLLALMGRLRGRQSARNRPKADLVTLLLGAFSDRTALAALLDRLTPAERAVLYDAQAECVFRVDRIRALELVPLPHATRDREN